MRTFIAFCFVLMLVFTGCQNSSKSSAAEEVQEAENIATPVQEEPFTLVSSEEFRTGSFPKYSYGDLYPDEANFTEDEARKEESQRLSKIVLAERQGNMLVIGSMQLQDAQANNYWFQGVTVNGVLVILHQTVKNGIGYSDMILVSADGSLSIELEDTAYLHELKDGRLIQVYSEPIPGSPNGGVKVLKVSQDINLTELLNIDFNDKTPTEVKLTDKGKLLVKLSLDDTGESMPEYVQVDI